MTKTRMAIISILCLAASAFHVSPSIAGAERPGSIEYGNDTFRPHNKPIAVPNASIVTESGTLLNLSQLQGKVVILNFWAPWCAPCVQEMPMFNNLQRDYGKHGLVVAAVSQDMGEGPAATMVSIKSFYGRYQLDQLPIFHDQYGSAYSMLGIKQLPTTLILDRQGNERARVSGTIEWTGTTFRSWLQQLLAER